MSKWKRQKQIPFGNDKQEAQKQKQVQKKIPFGNDKQEEQEQKPIRGSLRAIRQVTPFGKRTPGGTPTDADSGRDDELYIVNEILL